MTIPQQAAPEAPAAPLTPEAAAEQELSSLIAPAAKTRSDVASAVRLATAAGMTAEGALLTLAARPGLAGHLIAAACALDIAGRQVLCRIKVRRYRRQARWTSAAAIHAAALPAKVPAATLGAAARYLPAIAAASRQPQAWLYVVPCLGPDATCTVLCRSAFTRAPGGPVLVVLGQHPAQLPQVAAAALAHEAAHHAGPSRRLLAVTRHLRETGAWGYAAFGLAGKILAGWPGAIAAALAFHVLSLLALWAAEVRCDLSAARAEGPGVSLAGFQYMIECLAARTRAARTRRAIVTALHWAAGPMHPPVRLRRAIISALIQPPARRDQPTRVPDESISTPAAHGGEPL